MYDNFLLRIAAVWAFAFLLYYISCYRQELFLQIDKVLVAFGICWVVLIIADWGSLWESNAYFDRNLIRRGVFSHHLQVGWMLAALSLISLQRVFRKNSNKYVWIGTTTVLLIVLVLCQARGGLLVFFTGVIAYFSIHLFSLNRRMVFLSSICFFCAVGIVFALNPNVINDLVAPGASGRFIIWQNWHTMWQENVVKMIFGYGLGAPTENMFDGKTAEHFHNFYLNTIYYGGVVGFVLTLGWFFSLAKLVYQEKVLESPWVPVVVGMLAGFLTDGDKLFNYPGAFTFCFILPVFCLSFKDYPIIAEEI